ncbi:methyltransferase family protein [Sphingomonas beigongshangi]|jgi:protein-S-isoprenylcysteine O-methyltransferase Ste14|uniref:methyltransferase family protein n=1 Tax=Sphingomonas beigongshangi TaxID=2782540 RepID=UPI001AEEB19C|nr:isoprenylcysteine carboxylmethyltransferase family protein [Sphingomonas beigongshangi]
MSHSTGLPALAVLATGFVVFAALVLAARLKRRDEEGARRDGRSLLGIMVQGIAFAVCGSGPIAVALDPLGFPSLALAAATALLLVGAIGLFVWARRTMGRNWSVVARLRQDHALVTAGPFAHVRHPIYVAIALLLLATAIALGHVPRLVMALPLYALGTWLRIRVEEGLLLAAFGDAYRDYARRVKRFVPGLF